MVSKVGYTPLGRCPRSPLGVQSEKFSMFVYFKVLISRGLEDKRKGVRRTVVQVHESWIRGRSWSDGQPGRAAWSLTAGARLSASIWPPKVSPTAGRSWPCLQGAHICSPSAPVLLPMAFRSGHTFPVVMSLHGWSSGAVVLRTGGLGLIRECIVGRLCGLSYTGQWVRDSQLPKGERCPSHSLPRTPGP